MSQRDVVATIVQQALPLARQTVQATVAKPCQPVAIAATVVACISVIVMTVRLIT